jgi:uncharacterized membrane protein
MTITARRLAIALAISVALNLFLAGFVAMRALHGGRHHARGQHGPFLGPRKLSGGDPAIRQALRAAMKRRDGEFRAHGQHLHGARVAVSAAFGAEPFDAQALERAFVDLRARTVESQALMHGVLAEVAPTLTSAQRARLAEHALAREPGARRGGRGRPDVPR